MGKNIRYVPIADNAKEKPYYKFLSIPLVVPTKDQLKYYAKLKGNSKDELSFYDRVKIQTEGTKTTPEGYYFLKDGGILIAANVKMPHVTAEMMDWWIAWHQLDSLRYTLWNPEDHFDISLSDEDYKKVSNPNVPIREKIWDMTSYALESMNGEKPSNVVINFSHPTNFGFDINTIGSDYFQTFMGGNSSMQIGPFKIPVFACGYLSKDENGITEFRERWWFGYGVNEETGEVYKHFPKLLNSIASKFAMLLPHCHKEYEHLDKFLADIYSENKDKWV